MFNELTPLSFVIITDQQTTIPDCILGVEARCLHLSIHDDGARINVTEDEYDCGRHVQSNTRTMSASYNAGLHTYFYSICRRLVEEGLIVYKHQNPIYDALRTPILKSKIPYILWSDDKESGNLNWKQHHFAGNAIARFAFTETAKHRWQSNMVFDCDQIEEADFVSYLTSCLEARRSLKDASQRVAKDHNVLLISYYADPAQTVAAHRISYWHEKLEKIAERDGMDLSVTLMTATNSYKPRKNVIYVPDFAEVYSASEEARDLTERLDSARVNSFASYWSAHIRNWFNSQPDITFDSVILSGNPFFYFDLSKFFKEKWDATIFLDFRDPFANNPRFEYTEEHKELATELEEEYIRHADYALSVNHFCVDLLCLDENQKGVVIANGYEEEVADSVEALPRRVRNRDLFEGDSESDAAPDDAEPAIAQETIGFVYTGSFYADRDAEPFLRALDPQRHELSHIGRTTSADAHLDDYKSIHRYGLMPYSDVLAYCKSMDAGLIFTSGAAFEQTTKIFDYIAADIDIIIVTNGEIRTGELHRLTQDMTGIYWVENNPIAISEFLESYTPSEKKRENRYLFSRLHQTQKLFELLKPSSRPVVKRKNKRSRKNSRSQKQDREIMT